MFKGSSIPLGINCRQLLVGQYGFRKITGDLEGFRVHGIGVAMKEVRDQKTEVSGQRSSVKGQKRSSKHGAIDPSP